MLLSLPSGRPLTDHPLNTPHTFFVRLLSSRRGSLGTPSTEHQLRGGKLWAQVPSASCITSVTLGFPCKIWMIVTAPSAPQLSGRLKCDHVCSSFLRNFHSYLAFPRFQAKHLTACSPRVWVGRRKHREVRDRREPCSEAAGPRLALGSALSESELLSPSPGAGVMRMQLPRDLVPRPESGVPETRVGPRCSAEATASH